MLENFIQGRRILAKRGDEKSFDQNEAEVALIWRLIMWRVGILGLILLFGASQSVLAEELGAPSGSHNEYNNSNIYYYGQKGVDQQNNDQQYGIRTFRDPETGDRITQVRTKRQQPQEQQQVPLYIQPMVNPRF